MENMSCYNLYKMIRKYILEAPYGFSIVEEAISDTDLKISWQSKEKGDKMPVLEPKFMEDLGKKYKRNPDFGEEVGLYELIIDAVMATIKFKYYPAGDGIIGAKCAVANYESTLYANFDSRSELEKVKESWKEKFKEELDKSETSLNKDEDGLSLSKENYKKVKLNLHIAPYRKQYANWTNSFGGYWGIDFCNDLLKYYDSHINSSTNVKRYIVGRDLEKVLSNPKENVDLLDFNVLSLYFSFDTLIDENTYSNFINAMEMLLSNTTKDYLLNEANSILHAKLVPFNAKTDEGKNDKTVNNVQNEEVEKKEDTEALEEKLEEKTDNCILEKATPEKALGMMVFAIPFYVVGLSVLISVTNVDSADPNILTAIRLIGILLMFIAALCCIGALIISVIRIERFKDHKKGIKSVEFRASLRLLIMSLIFNIAFWVICFVLLI